MTRLKVFNSHTNSTYYLNNVDVSCAKQYSFIGKTDYNNNIVHTPLPHLEYSIQDSDNDIVDTLNTLYNKPFPPHDWNGYFPANNGIIISDMFTDSAPVGTLPTYTSHRTDCNNITIAQTTYWCPPVIKRNSFSTLSGTIQSSRVSSFSYIHNKLLSSVFTLSRPFLKFMIYDNTKLFNVSQKQIFQIYPGDSMSNFCLPKQSPDGQYCPSGAIGACINNQYMEYIKGPCLQDCSWNADQIATACKNFKSFIHSIHHMHETGSTRGFNSNELIIKSWNYNPNSGMSDRGIMYNASMDIWVEQRPNTDSDWGWNDVSNLSSNKNIPLLAFGITISDKLNLSQSDISNIKHLYADLSNNLEPSFNEYRRKKSIPLMPYRIGLDISCLTRPDCSNPFFDLSLILNTAPPGPTPKICCTKQCGHGGCSSDCCVGMFGAGCSMHPTCNCSC